MALLNERRGEYTSKQVRWLFIPSASFRLYQLLIFAKVAGTHEVLNLQHVG